MSNKMRQYIFNVVYGETAFKLTLAAFDLTEALEKANDLVKDGSKVTIA